MYMVHESRPDIGVCVCKLFTKVEEQDSGSRIPLRYDDTTLNATNQEGTLAVIPTMLKFHCPSYTREF